VATKAFYIAAGQARLPNDFYLALVPANPCSANPSPVVQLNGQVTLGGVKAAAARWTMGRVDQRHRQYCAETVERREAQLLVVQAFRRLLTPLGYSRRQLCWYRHGLRSKTACNIWLTERLVSVELVRFDDGASRKLSHPDPVNASVSIGMSALVPSLAQWRAARDYSQWSLADDADLFFQLFEKFGLPQLRRWNEA
jgi:hypothetical protein